MNENGPAGLRPTDPHYSKGQPVPMHTISTPGRASTTLHVATVLDRAADLLAARGLHHGNYWYSADHDRPDYPGDEPLDVFGAIGVASGVVRVDDVTREIAFGDGAGGSGPAPAVRAMLAHLNLGDDPNELGKWSDQHRRHGPVVAALRACAAQLRAGGAR